MSVSSNNETGRRADVLAYMAVALLLTLFFGFWFNRFAGLRSGDGEFTGGVAFLAHRLPYRDYYTAGPPLNQLKSAVEFSLFGQTLLVSRACGVMERLVLGALLFVWIRRLFSRSAAMLVTFVTMVISAGDRTDPLASYNHDAIFFAVLCGLLSSFVVSTQTTRNRLGFGLAAGVAAGCSSLTKQTVGLGTTVAVLTLLALATFSLRGIKSTLQVFFVYLMGFALPVLGTGIYLEHLGVLSAALHMMFVAGPAAKASGGHVFLTRELSVAAGNPVWVSLAFLALLLISVAVWRNLHAPNREEPAGSCTTKYFFWGAAFVLLLAYTLSFTSLPALEDFGKASVYFSFLGCAALGVSLILLALRRPEQRERNWQLALLAAVGWAVAFTLSLSWPAFEAMTLPALALPLALAHDGARLWGRRFLYLVAAAMVFLQVREKLELPFAFAHEEEPAIRFAREHSELPALRGMRLPTETIRLLDTTTQVFQQAAPRASDPVFTYPEFGLVYALADRNPPTLAGSHNIDVVPDGFAKQEAERLLANPPKAILYARPAEADLLDDERIWRNGQPSGQRDLIAALDKITAHYDLVTTFVLKAGDTPIRLYRKR